MPEIVILGTANAVAEANRENTQFAILGERQAVLVDCSGSPIPRLEQAGVAPLSITDLIATHFHPDHVSGIPVFLMDLWLMGRRRPLVIHGLSETLDRVEKMMMLFQWETWPGFFPVSFHRLPAEEMAVVLEGDEMRIWSSPVCHLIPTIGLRVTFPQIGRSMAYSCDTEPCPQVVRLARGVDLLLHEATGASTGHSSAAQAGEIARDAVAASLYLIHYTLKANDGRALVEQAREAFPGPVILARDLARIPIDNVEVTSRK